MKIRSVIVYSVLRILVFLVPLGLMMMLPIFREMWWFALGFAALIGISLSVIFLRRPLDEISTGIAARRDAHHHETQTERDTAVEDAVDDDLRAHAPHDRPDTDQA